MNRLIYDDIEAFTDTQHFIHSRSTIQQVVKDRLRERGEVFLSVLISADFSVSVNKIHRVSSFIWF